MAVQGTGSGQTVPGAGRPAADVLITGASEVITCQPTPGDPIGRVPSGVVAVAGERILAVGAAADVSAGVDTSRAQEISAEGGVVAPGFVDAHTHLVFGGSRAREYAARLTHTREQVRAMGIPTGIMATVSMTRAEEPDTLAVSAAERLDAMLRHGTTTAESKSGYGLTLDDELKLLQVNRRLDADHPIDLVSTFMGAHDFPAEVARERYVEVVVLEMIPSVTERGLARFCDVFCDEGYYTVEESRRILRAGIEAGLEPKIHADQYAAVGGAELAGELGAVSFRRWSAAHVGGRSDRGADAAHRLRGAAPEAHRRPRVDRGRTAGRSWHRPVPGWLLRVYAACYPVRLPVERAFSGTSPSGGHRRQCAGVRPGRPRCTWAGVAGRAGRHSDLGDPDPRGPRIPNRKQRSPAGDQARKGGSLMVESAGPRAVRAPRGGEISCKGWLQEAALRMLMNNLDPEVAERPDDLVVYGGRGQAARNWNCFDAIVRTLRELDDDETLLIQSGKPVAVFYTHREAPRVLIANSNLVPHWATQQHFDELAAKGLIMFGQMTAGSWIYIGTQGILQGTFETLGALARQQGWDGLQGRIVLTAGLGGMGGAQPLAVTMNGGVALVVEVDPRRAQRRLQTRYVDRVVEDVEEAVRLCEAAARGGEALSVGLVGNAAEVLPQLAERGFEPDVVTDQTPAHDVLMYVPEGTSVEEADRLRTSDPAEYERRSMPSMARHVEAMLEFRRRGSEVFDYGNNLRQRALDAGVEDAFAYPGFVPAYIRPLFCEGKGPFRWVALSGEPEDIYRTDEAVMELFPDDSHLHRWLTMARERVEFQGLPARICWLGYGERCRAGHRFNQMVARGEVKAPIVIGRDHLDAGSVASPNRETEGMRDGTDAVSDWPILNALLNAVGGASWVSFHHGGGVGIGYAQHAGQVIVADGTVAAERRLERVLRSDPGLGVVRHADAGYERAIEVANRCGIRMPMLGSGVERGEEC